MNGFTLGASHLMVMLISIITVIWIFKIILHQLHFGNRVKRGILWQSLGFATYGICGVGWVAMMRPYSEGISEITTVCFLTTVIMALVSVTFFFLNRTVRKF